MWLVQYAGIRPDNTDQVMEILKAKNIPFVPVGIRPFTTEILGIEDADLTGPVMAYGSCKLVKLVSELGLRPGVFFEPSSFNVMAWSQFLNNEMVNDKPIVAPVRDWRQSDGAMMLDSYFVRPVMDLKLFSGGVKPEDVSFDAYLTEKLNASSDYENALIAVSTPKVIHGEWRVFIVNRKIVTVSQYRLNGELILADHMPMEGASFALRIINTKWIPHDHCVMDVALTDDGFKVIEFNCINASGLYKADAEKLVDALNSLMV